ncbi:hypothetical protein AgCh_024068 [Apium graveolens]
MLRRDPRRTNRTPDRKSQNMEYARNITIRAVPEENVTEPPSRRGTHTSPPPTKVIHVLPVPSPKHVRASSRVGTSKKVKYSSSLSQVESYLGPLVILFLGDDKLSSWRDLVLANRASAKVKAAVQLLFLSLEDASEAPRGMALLESLEMERRSLIARATTAEEKLKMVS